ncbi:helix-turn-helix domain-containing protein [Lysinibacillus sp. NPDC097287]|uniref:helix-turn-helix domain-containing protein n=1 Tax=Lysinibacillus sp. NPDC097287 TaxID=3364144 RepID=UPI003805B5CF
MTVYSLEDNEVNEVMHQIARLIDKNRYDESEWEDARRALNNNPSYKLMERHINAIQLLKQKENLFRFSTKILEILHQINLEIASLAPITEILKLSANRLKGVSKAKVILIAMLDKDKNVLRIEAVSGSNEEELLHFEQSIDDGIAKLATSSHQPFIVSEIKKSKFAADPLVKLLIKTENIASLVASPLIAHQELQGIVFVATNTIIDSKSFLLQMLENYCYQTAIAIYNNKLYSNEIRISTLHSELFEAALNKGGNEGIIQKLAHFINEPILLLDEFGNLIHQAHPLDHIDSEFRYDHSIIFKEILTKSEQVHSFEIFVDEAYYSVFMITFHNRTVAYLVLPKQLHRYDHLSIVAIEQTKNVLALQINQERTSIEVENHLRHDYLYDLIFGLESEKNLVRRARYLNISFDKKHKVIVLSPNSHPQMNEQIIDNQLVQMLEKFRYILGISILPLSMSHGEKLILIVPEDKVKSTSNFVLKYAKENSSFTNATIGISNTVKMPKDYIKGFEEAKKAAEFASAFQKDSPIVHYDDLGIVGVLFNTENPESMKVFMEKYLQPIIDYDQKNKSDLIRTLQTYLDNESVIQISAEQLHVHYNTLRYRLNRIEEILSVDLSNPNNRLNIQIALIIAQLLKV